MKYSVFLLLLALTIVLSAKTPEGFKNKKVERTIDLTSQFARHSIKINAVNTAGKSLSTYFLALDETQATHLSLLEVRDKSGVVLQTTVGEKGKSGETISHQLYSVALNKVVEANGNVELDVKIVLTHAMEAYPNKIAQTDRQLVRYFDNHYFLSPYTTESQTTNVKVPATIENKSELAPTSVKGNLITYGPYQDTPSFSSSQMLVHFENNSPFLTVTSLVKEIEVSHWGNVAVEETYHVQNDGAKLKTSFSRFDYQRSQGNAPSHVAKFKEILPRGARDAYYRDEVGNISTSHFSHTEDGALLEFSPRFPLFGGWKIGFYLGYNLPAEFYLFNSKQDSSLYVLKMSFSAEFEGAVIDDLTVRVILPEGAKNAQVHVPFATDKVKTDSHFTYLDTSGRQVLIIHKKNIAPEHNQEFQVTYNFSSVSMLQEPLLLVGAFFVFFVVVMVYVRLEFNIGQVKKISSASRFQDSLLRYKDICDQRTELHTKLDSVLDKASRTKSTKDYNSAKTTMDNNLGNLVRQATRISQEIEPQDAQLGRKIRQIEQKEEQRDKAQAKLHASELAKRPGSSNAELYKAYETANEEFEAAVSELMENL